VNLNSMAVFARVVEENGFTQAARRLGMSKSAVSKQVSQLEDRVGARLLQRTTRRVSLTDVGATFYERCARILAEAEEAELAVSRLQSAPRGTLRISAPMSFGRSHLAPAVAEFLCHYPELRVDMQLSDRVVDLVDEGYDLAVRIARLTDSSLIARRLCPAPRVTCAAPAYLAARGTPLHPGELTSHNCLLYSYLSTGDTWHFPQPGRGDIAVPVTGTFRANNGDVLLEGAMAGLGIVVAPAFMAEPALADGRLVEILADYRDLGAAVHAVYPHNRHLPVKVRAFIDFLVNRFAYAVGDPHCDKVAAHGVQATDARLAGSRESGGERPSRGARQ